MLVTDIKISQYHYCAKSSRHIATVGMTLKNQIVTLLCRLELPKDETPPKRAIAFVTEATRQMLRMPEYRSGKNALEFSDSLGELTLRQTA